MYVCMYVNSMHTWFLWTLEEDVRSPEIGVKNNCEPPCCGSWNPNLDPLQEHRVILPVIATITTILQVSDKPQLFIVNTLFHTSYFEARQLRSSLFSQSKKNEETEVIGTFPGQHQANALELKCKPRLESILMHKHFLHCCPVNSSDEGLPVITFQLCHTHGALSLTTWIHPYSFE